MDGAVNNEIYKFSRCAQQLLVRSLARSLARFLLPSRSRENFHWISRLATVCAPCVHIATQAPFHETWGESFKVAASRAQGQRLDLPELAASSMRRVNARITQGQRLSSPGQWPPVSRPTSGLFEVNQGENRKTRGRNKRSRESPWIIGHARFANFPFIRDKFFLRENVSYLAR